MRRRSSLASIVFVSLLAAPTLAFAAPQGDPEPPPALPQPEEKKPDPVAAPPLPPPPETTKQPVLQVPEPEPQVTPPPPPPPPPIDDDDEDDEPKGWAEGDHFEFSMGFLAGQRSYSKTSFSFDEGTAELIQGADLTAPFVNAPFDLATVVGLRYDARIVMSFIRMTVGFDVPFPTYKASDSTQFYDVSGTQRKVTVQSVSAKELRFGIGGEYPYKRIAVFADLIGGVHWVNTELAIDGFTADYSAVNFAFSGRGGLRAHVRKWFYVTASGEVGFIGDIKWNAELSVGFFAK